MLRPLLLSIFILFLFFRCAAQTDPAEKEILDSIAKNDEFMKMLDSLDDASSYAKINFGVGNRLFSVNNNALNALESNSQIVFTPSFSYYHKSGFGISATGYLLNNNNKEDFYQYSITPSYDYQTGKTVGAGISYTRYIRKEKYSGATSPIQNDFYGYLYFKKPWLQPGFALGYSNGIFKEIQVVKANFPRLGGLIDVTDTATTNLKSTSLIGTLEHTFQYYSLFSHRDDLSITSTFLVNTGTTDYNTTHQNNFSERVKTKSKLRHQESSSSFEVQSLGLSADIIYTIGKFDFEPQIYFDYYLPSTTEKRFTQVFTFNVGFIF